MNWKIIDKIYVFESYDGFRIFIANPEKKKYWNPVKKISESKDSPKLLENKGFNLRFKEGHPEIELSGVWKRIENLDTTDILEQISGVTMTNGVINNVVFSFCNENPMMTVMACPGTDFYQQSEEEFLRLTNLTLFKKTKKFKTGYRYDTETGTCWYLGDVYIHRPNSFSSYGKNFEENGVVASAFINSLPKTKTIDEVYENYTLMDHLSAKKVPSEKLKDTIFLISSPESMVESSDCPEINWKGSEYIPEDFYIKRIENFIKTHKKPYSYASSKYHYYNFFSLFDFFLISGNKEYSLKGDKENNLVKEIIEKELEYIYTENFIAISKSPSSGKETESLLCTKFLNNFLDNYYYYNELVIGDMIEKLFDIDLNKLSEKVVSSNKLNLTKIIDTSKTIREQFKSLIDNFCCYNDDSILKISFLYVNSEFRDISKFLKKDNNYRDLISNMYKEALSTNGGNLKNFVITNMGTVKHPDLKYTFTITLEDIMNHYKVKSIYDIPESIQKDIIENKLYEVQFETKEGLNIKI